MSKRKLKALRIFAVFMLITISNQLFFPTLSYALTSGDTQPEVFGYQPVDATDNVSLPSGKFNYTIPITSIPEFPMAVGYSAGLGMDQEASVFGFGFNGFSGAITRSVNGLPDDLDGALDGAKKNYSYGNEPMWDVNTTVGMSLGTNLSDYFSAGAGITTVYGYNNYAGFYGAIGLGVSAAVKLGSATHASVGLGIYSDSRSSSAQYGFTAALGVSQGIQIQYSGSESQDSKKWQNSVSLSYSSPQQKHGSITKGISLSDLNQSFPSNNVRVSSSSLAPLSYVVPSTGGVTASTLFSIYGMTFGTQYSKYKMLHDLNHVEKNGYGFMYLYNYDRSNTDNIADMTLEGEDSYNEASFNNPSYLQKDNYNINTMGMAGGMELYQKSYGIVSRNFSSNITTSVQDFNHDKTQINEVHPWYSTNQSSINKSVDIIAMLKMDPEEEGASAVMSSLFDEKERANFNGANQRFDQEPVFKMRGDYAGEYDLSSGSYTDHDPNPYSLIHVSGTSSDPKFAFLGVEKNVPLYYPTADRDYNAYTNSHNIERSTHITKHTIGSILTSYNALKAVNSRATPTSSTAATDPFNFNQSFYSEYAYVRPTSVAKSGDITLNDHLVKMNLLQHLDSLRGTTVTPPVTIGGITTPGGDPLHSYFSDLTGSIEVESVNGLRYFFDLPVFNKTSKNEQMCGKGKNPPVTTSGEYSSYTRDGKEVNRNKITTEDGYMYPYAWMLTAIVGDDYIDFDNIPGPSDGDIGYWVKFKYVKAADNYRWRQPFTGLSYYPGISQKQNDQIYSVSSGTKEIYYLSEIESSNYICKYQYHKRMDGVDAAAFANGDAVNTLTSVESVGSSPDRTGDNFQFVATQIDLYKKHNNGSNSAVIDQTAQKIIKSTKFYYDYTTCPHVPNNYVKYAPSTIIKSGFPYHIDYGTSHASEAVETGKLTLRKVQHIAYDESGDPANASLLPSYTFNYYADDDAKYNPDYNTNAVDQWGNYMKNAEATGLNSSGTDDGTGNRYYEHFTEYVKSDADDNAKAYKLKTIQLPSGGNMEINYEAQTYGYVENQNPYVMRHIKEIGSVDATHTLVKVDVTDMGSSGFNLTTGTTTTASGEEKKVLSVGDKVYGEVAFYRSTAVSTDPDYYNESSMYMVNEEAQVSNIGSATLASDGHYYQDVTLASLAGSKPFVSQCEVYMYGESVEMQATKDNLSGTCASVQDFRDQHDNATSLTAGDAFRIAFAHISNLSSSATGMESKVNTCFGVPGTAIYPHWSFLRTPIYKAKYTGAVVSSVKLHDGFNYATQADGSVGTTENEYGTNYFYDLKTDGSGTSSGVATNEPGGGKSCIEDIYTITGSGFMPAPGVFYSKTTLENLYHADGAGASTGDKISRNKGKTCYEFYTPKDDGLQFGDHFKSANMGFTSPVKGNFFLFGVFTFFMLKFTILGKTITIKIPTIVPIVLDWKLEDRYHLKSYAYTDYTDMFGKLKAVRQIDAFGQELGTQKYNYYGLDESVPVYKNGFGSTSTTDQKPGKMDQVWSEAYYAKQLEINQYVALPICMAKTKKDFCYTDMKYSYVPSVLKEVVSTMDGMTTTTSYTGFDYYTGTPLEAKSNDSYGNTKISRTEPAYWEYPEMGPRSVNDAQLNNLTATTGTYMYLNSVGPTHLIGAGVVKWTKGSPAAPTTPTWDMIPYLRPKRTFATTTTYSYTYAKVPGSTIRTAYTPGGRSSDASFTTTVSPRIQRNASIYKAYQGYTYEVPINTDGTFKTFTAFNYSAASTNPAWKQLSTNELYSANGVLVQSKDVLSKYACQLLGYNFSNTIAAVSNASWGACAYDGAENTYQTSTG
ncbi:MAG: hypothetical protein ACXVPM_19170, partial [Bacteroidia bacterium]